MATAQLRGARSVPVYELDTVVNVDARSPRISTVQYDTHGLGGPLILSIHDRSGSQEGSLGSAFPTRRLGWLWDIDELDRWLPSSMRDSATITVKMEPHDPSTTEANVTVQLHEAQPLAAAGLTEYVFLPLMHTRALTLATLSLEVRAEQCSFTSGLVGMVTLCQYRYRYAVRQRSGGRNRTARRLPFAHHARGATSGDVGRDRDAQRKRAALSLRRHAHPLRRGPDTRQARDRQLLAALGRRPRTRTQRNRVHDAVG